MDRTPFSELAKARLRLKRRIAAAFLLAMAEDDTSFEQVDERLGQKLGSTRRFLIGLMDGTSKAMDDASDLAFAMDHEIHFSLTRFADVPAAWRAPETDAEPDRAINDLSDDREALASAGIEEGE